MFDGLTSIGGYDTQHHYPSETGQHSGEQVTEKELFFLFFFKAEKNW